MWQQVAAPIVIDGQSYPVFDPALWSFWLPWFLVVIALELVFTVATCTAAVAGPGPSAVVNAVLAAASAIPAIWLLQNGQLLEPGGGRLPCDAAGVGRRRRTDLDRDHRGLGLAITAGWDAVDGFRKAYLAERSQRARPA